MESVSPSFLRLLGCSTAVELQEKQLSSGIVVLFFGQPAYEPGIGTQPGEFGTLLLGDSPTFVTTTDIRIAIQAWIDGFINGSESSSTSCRPRNTSTPKVTLAIGTNNEPVAVLPSIAQAESQDYVTRHGRDWAILVNSIGTYVNGNNLSSRVEVAGANNVELLFNTSEGTIPWAEGYQALARYRYYSVGDCSGCPYVLPGEDRSGRIPDNGWTYQSIWQISRGFAGARPLPQIYEERGVQAAQWQAIAEQAEQDGLAALDFVGAFTQQQACDDRGSVQRPPQAGSEFCPSTYNSPAQGWQQLWRELNSSFRTAQSLPYSSDVRWDFDFAKFQR